MSIVEIAFAAASIGFLVGILYYRQATRRPRPQPRQDPDSQHGPAALAVIESLRGGQ